jgi:predicted ATPase
MQALPGQSKAQLENSVANAVRRWLLPFVPSLTQPSRGEIERALSGVDTVAYVEHLDVGQYLDLVNSVLEGKRLTTRQTGDVGAGLSIEVNYDDGFRARGLGVLSSGEYQIASLAFSALALPESGILLIDEPEISLQLEWQRGLLSRLTRLTKCVQLIACTHSPAIAAGFDMSEVKLVSGSIDIDQEMFF